MINFQHSPPLLIRHIVNSNKVLLVTKYRMILMSMDPDFHIISSTLLV